MDEQVAIEILARRSSVSFVNRLKNVRTSAKHTKSPSLTHDYEFLRYLIVFLLTSGYFLIELGYGTMIGSVALIGDALNMFSDVVSLVIGFYAMATSRAQHSSYENTFGKIRLEVVASLMNATFMLSICLNICIDAGYRFVKGYNDNDPIGSDTETLLLISSLGLLVNIVTIAILTIGRKHADLNLRTVLLHVAGDALGSLAVVGSALLIKYGKGHWRLYADPVSAIAIAIIITFVTIPLIRESAKVLMGSTPSEIDMRSLLQRLVQVEGVVEIHDFHVWTLANASHVGAMHVIIVESTDFMRVSDDLKTILHHFGVHSSTLQPEIISDTEQVGAGSTCHEPVCKNEECIELMCCAVPIAACSHDHLQTAP